MDVTTQQLMQILPMDEQLRFQLRATYEAAPPQEQYRLSVILWEQYEKYIQLKTEELMGLAMEDKDFKPTGENYYEEMREKAEKEILSEANTRNSMQKLSRTREELERVIRASLAQDKADN